MAASTTTTTAKISVSSKEPTCFLDNQNQPIKQKRCKAREVTCFLDIQNQPIKQKRCKAREVTISATSISDSSSSPSSLSHQPHRKLDSPSVVSPDSYWCCPASKATPTLSPPPPLISPLPRRSIIPPHFCQRTDLPPFYTSDSSGNSRIQLTPRYFSPDMDFSSAVPASNAHSGLQNESFPSSFTKFNSALTAGLLNPMSPPPPPQENVRSPTLFTLMANEPDIHPRSQIPSQTIAVSGLRALLPPQDKQSLMMQRISNLLGSRSPGNQFNDTSNSDIKLTLSSKDGISVSMNVHRQILVAHSRFFSVKLSDRWAKQQRSTPYIVEIADCDDVEIYIETLKLLYCRDIKKKLMMEDVPRILGILKVSAAIGFDAGVLSCLEYLEAAPWAEDEEEKVASLLSELHLEGAGAGEVLKRVSVEFNNGPDEGSDNEEVLLKLLHVVLEGKDEKARREMKGLLLKMLRESSSSNDLRKESLYSAFERCLKLLRQHFLQAANSELQEVSQIARQADNLSWILDIMIDRQIAEDFLRTWAAQSDLSEVHSKVPVVHRFEISRVTSRLFVGIGRGQLLAPKDVRFMLLQTWLVPFYNDFGWMRRASKGIDRHLVEEGLSNTILTLPLAWQQDILLAWFDRFMNSGEDCPNIQRGFEVWWRRAFWRRHGEQERPHPLRVMASSVDNTL